MLFSCYLILKLFLALCPIVLDSWIDLHQFLLLFFQTNSLIFAIHFPLLNLYSFETRKWYLLVSSFKVKSKLYNRTNCDFLIKLFWKIWKLLEPEEIKVWEIFSNQLSISKKIFLFYLKNWGVSLWRGRSRRWWSVG